MPDELDLIQNILIELRSIKIGTPAWSSGEAWGFISAGEGHSLIINGRIKGLMRDLSHLLYAYDPSLSNIISKKDWGGLVRRVMGPILGSINLEYDLIYNSDLALIRIKDELGNSNWNYNSRHFIFGCSLLYNSGIAPFTVGSVTIMNRNYWLGNALKQDRINHVTHRRLTSIWNGKKVRRRTSSIESSNEQEIIDAVGDGTFVCVVKTDGIFGEFAKDKAILSVRLTLLGVSLMWNRPSQALEDINLVYDGPSYRRSYAYYQEGYEFFGGSKRQRSIDGAILFSNDWDLLIQRHKDWWIILSEINTFLNNASLRPKRPNMMNTFLHALIWFHEACRENMPLIAITKYMSALDSLSHGRRASGITNLISARLNVDPEDIIVPAGITYKQAINELYTNGRNRPLHGNSDRLNHDWQDQRELAEKPRAHV